MYAALDACDAEQLTGPFRYLAYVVAATSPFNNNDDDSKNSSATTTVGNCSAPPEPAPMAAPTAGNNNAPTTGAGSGGTGRGAPNGLWILSTSILVAFATTIATGMELVG